MPANHVAKWDGITWTPLDGGVNGTVFALGPFVDQDGQVLYAGGSFTAAGGLGANNIAKWGPQSP